MRHRAVFDMAARLHYLEPADLTERARSAADAGDRQWASGFIANPYCRFQGNGYRRRQLGRLWPSRLLEFDLTRGGPSLVRLYLDQGRAA